MMICIFVPGIILDPVILQLAASFALCLLILLEVLLCCVRVRVRVRV